MKRALAARSGWLGLPLSLPSRPTLSGTLGQLTRRLNHANIRYKNSTAFSPLTTMMQVSALQPDFGVNESLFPALPQIISEDIRLRVFTHRSYFGRPTNVFEDTLSDPSPDNEKYEHLGDSVLQLVVTNLLMEMYPGLRVGPSTKVRAMVVGNITLADISRKYMLPEQLRLHPAQTVTLRASVNVQADVLESFIGGLYTDQGLEAVKAWLVPLFRPYAQTAYAIVRAQHGLPPVVSTDVPTISHDPTSPTSSVGSEGSNNNNNNPGTAGHLALFNQHLQKGSQRVEWLYSDQHPTNGSGSSDSPTDAFGAGSKTTPVWAVQVLVDGEEYGRGRGNTKKAARNEAAKQGLVRLGLQV
ncbi:ribonuclease III domain-containing protein [Roridomyces roridus]|uniref:Ribonuclease III domain-containing protein n=1 Tax=Roridomyces roridus TaxID=1738132 RepID=A0AAD7C5H0_9AGAR|nr:ribonuclease III domain-containing protein [Roridomyces roridus]